LTNLRIGLLWHSAAAGNLGVGALTVGNIALVREAAARAGLTPHFTIFGGREPFPAYVTGDDIADRTIDGRYMVSPRGYLADVRNIDVMLDIGGGDSFTDIYPDKRFIYQIGTKLMALWAGVPLILSPQTIGPFSRGLHTRVAAWICRRANMVFARDPLSMDLLHRLAPTAKSMQVIDVAFALPFERPVRKSGEPIKVGINVSGLLMNGGFGSSNNDYGLTLDYPALTRRLIAEFTAMPGVEVHLVPHVIAPNLPRDDDGASCDALKAEFPGVVRVPNFKSPSAAKSYISGLDFLTGARMHATIAAYSAGVPVVPISYSRKFEGLFGGLNFPWTVPARNISTDAAFNFILDAYARRGAVAADIAAGTPIIEAGLENYRAELTRQFIAIAGR
jgi:polysaccharide pyruvyl transferase WcaK-like protein